MSRTVTALYDSRQDAETARGRLVSGIKTRSTRIIAKDTVAAVDSLDIDAKEKQSHRAAISQGCYLLAAEIEAGQNPKRVVTLLEEAADGDGNEAPAEAVHERPPSGVPTQVEDRPVQGGATEVAAQQRFEEPGVTQPVGQPTVAEAKIEEPRASQRFDERTAQPVQRSVQQQQPVQEERVPLAKEELRIGTRQVSRGGARVRSVIRETPAEEQVDLSEEHVDLEKRPSERRLTTDEVKAGGLLRERVFEIREMREEAVITKEAFVREEIIVRKTVQQRTETIRDTVRRTEVEVEELPRSDEPRRSFFGGRPSRK
ncbi:MAG: DUF2382 domain-containing protein [Sphingomonas sp.]|nr:DUF2382 domain-containing protein [Sphingomonas sp.]